MRKLIPQILEHDPSIQVVGTAIDGAFALKKIDELHPEVITLDLEMPGMGGLDVLREVTRRSRTPVIVVSSHSTQGAAVTFKALSLGAFDFVAKPIDASAHMQEVADQLITKIKVAAQSGGIAMTRPLPPQTARPTKGPGSHIVAPTRIIAIGISTGGPNTLQYLFSQLPSDFPGTILVVQHMPEGFTEMFARRLDECSAIRVKEAQSGDLLVAGRALICPGNRHLKVKSLPLGRVAVLSDEPRVNGHRPSVDVLFRSLAQEFGPEGVAVLMTGMGDDGAVGMGAVKAAGGLTIAQSEESCVVYGMPRAAVERGFVTRIISLEALANTLQVQCMPEQARARAASGQSSGGKV
jgi:two-component system chemotaxis response regulator CheB